MKTEQSPVMNPSRFDFDPPSGGGYHTGLELRFEEEIAKEMKKHPMKEAKKRVSSSSLLAFGIAGKIST